MNGGWLPEAREGARELDLYAWGGDVFWNSGGATLEAEYGRMVEDSKGLANIGVEGWYVQGGALVKPKVELAARYQERDANLGEFASHLRWTTVGTNYYLRDHNLKGQAEYTFKRENPAVANDALQVQLQLDY